MREKMVLDLSKLPLHGMATASPTWWGTLAFMLIEGTGFVLVIAIYLYLGSLAQDWPPAPPPDLLPGTLLTLVLVASVIPNLFVSRWAENQELAKVRWGIMAMSVIGIVPLVIRAFEFPALHVKWDDNAYGSILWTMLGLHTTHLVTDLIDTIVLAVLMFTRHGKNRRRFGDVQDNALYWNFVVLTWLPLYACIYFLPRL
jgi:heme/copper-type cytochrome/quinol oxidase subunit 3